MKLQHAVCLATDCVDEERLTLALENVESGSGRLIPGDLPTKSGKDPGLASVQMGDVLFGKLRPYLAKSWLAAFPAHASTELLCLRPNRRTVEPRWLSYLVMSQSFLDWATASSDGTKMPRTSWERLREFDTPIPPIEAQRAIADFLDAETARIDSLIEFRSRQTQLLIERESGLVSKEVWGNPLAKTVRLKFLCGTPTSGNRDHAALVELTPVAVPCLRGLNIRPGYVDRNNLMAISVVDHMRHPETNLHAGDLAIVRSGAAGAAAIIPSELDGCNCVDLVVVRRSTAVLPEYLQYVVNSDEAQEQVRRRTTGAILSHFNAMDAAELLVPWVDPSDQSLVVTRLDSIQRRLTEIRGRAAQSIDLLRERKQALIPAAVTGQLDRAREIAEEAS